MQDGLELTPLLSTPRHATPNRFKLILNINITQFQQVISLNELEHLLSHSFESVDSQEDTYTGIATAYLPLHNHSVFKGAYKCFKVSQQTQTATVVYSLGDRLLDILDKFSRHPSTWSAEITSTFVASLKLIHQLAQHHNNARVYFFAVLNSNRISDSLIDIVYQISEGNTQLNVIQHIISLFANFATNFPTEVLNFLCEKGIWMQGATSGSQYRKGSFLYLYDVEKSTKHFTITRQMVTLFVNYVNAVIVGNTATRLDTKHQSALDSIVSFMFQVISDYWIIREDSMQHNRRILHDVFNSFAIIITKTNCITPAPYLQALSGRIARALCHPGPVQSTLIAAVDPPTVDADLSDEVVASRDELSCAALILLQTLLDQHSLERSFAESLVNSILYPVKPNTPSLFSTLINTISMPVVAVSRAAATLCSLIILIRIDKEFYISSLVSDQEITNLAKLIAMSGDPNQPLTLHSIIGLLKELSVSQFQLTDRLLMSIGVNELIKILKLNDPPLNNELYPLLDNIHANSIYYGQFLHDLHSHKDFWTELIDPKNKTGSVVAAATLRIISAQALSMTAFSNKNVQPLAAENGYSSSERSFVLRVQEVFQGPKIEKYIDRYISRPNIVELYTLRETLINLCANNKGQLPEFGMLILSPQQTSSSNNSNNSNNSSNGANNNNKDLMYDLDAIQKLFKIDADRLDLIGLLRQWNDAVQRQQQQLELARAFSRFVRVSQLTNKSELLLKSHDGLDREKELVSLILKLADAALVDSLDIGQSSMCAEESEWLQTIFEVIAVASSSLILDKSGDLAPRTTQQLLPHFSQLLLRYLKFLDNVNNNTDCTIFYLLVSSLLSVTRRSVQVPLALYKQLISPLSSLILCKWQQPQSVANNNNNSNNNNKRSPSLSNISIYTLQSIIFRIETHANIPSVFPNDLIYHLIQTLRRSLNVEGGDTSNDATLPDITTANAILELFITFTRQPLLGELLIVKDIISTLSSIELKYLQLSILPLWSKCLTLTISLANSHGHSDRVAEQLLEFVVSHKERFIYYADPRCFLHCHAQQYLTKQWIKQLSKLTYIIYLLSKSTKRFYLTYRVFADLQELCHRLVLILTAQIDEHLFIERHFKAMTLKEKRLNQSSKPKVPGTPSQGPKESVLTLSLLSNSASRPSTSTMEPTDFTRKIENQYYVTLRNVLYSLVNFHYYIRVCQEFVPVIPHSLGKATFGTYLFINQLSCSQLKSGDPTRSLPKKRQELVKQIGELNCLLLSLLAASHNIRDEEIMSSVEYVKTQFCEQPSRQHPGVAQQTTPPRVPSSPLMHRTSSSHLPTVSSTGAGLGSSPVSKPDDQFFLTLARMIK
ncbi:hypothetical protein SAMD00019534_054960 [Acytostelium subglobosum LB1]|uniref:hypothetical protein n=1 Tax=Acytostelium subglobosum LB1 TaxID=1410327 RepID=UPI000644A05A|nr:hypothetical protein SAMD00019534_054960 [Acytostelium subglobosum LB1]GAM22321.1 hypothetical protein SAMD00019534_054960 [Acytostelium subglobosum LB1]|eukprot:XP_012754441.1 hypothetical protein SAMD00019534_054960 [Acytostelium subglobosum LB1]